MNFTENVRKTRCFIVSFFSDRLSSIHSDLYEYNQHVKKQVDQNIFGINREDLERRQLTNELNSLDDNRLLLRQKVALVQEHYKQLEMNFQREMKRRKELEDKYQQQIKDLRVSVEEYVGKTLCRDFVHEKNLFFFLLLGKFDEQ